MLWCIPTQHFRFPSRRKRARTAATENMQLHHHHPNSDEEDATTESGIFYLVPNKYGPGKTLVRRPRPAPTSAPLDEDFDAATTTRGARTEWEPSPRVRARSPLPPMYPPLPPTPAPRATSPKAQTQTQLRMQTPTSPTPSKRRDGPSTARPLSGEGAAANAAGNASGDVLQMYGEYGHYMTELERKFGGGPDLTLSPTRSRGVKAGRATQTQVQVQTQPQQINTDRIGMPARLGSVGRAGGGGVGTGGGTPRARQSFEIVDRRVLEDGPERTVTISTWREQVAEEADQRANMDIYYLDARDYASAQGGSTDLGGEGEDVVVDGDRDGVVSEADSLAKKRMRTLPPRPAIEDGAGSNTMGSIRTITDELSGESEPELKRQSTATTTTTTTTHNSLGLSNHEQSRPSASGSSLSPPWNNTPPRTPPRTTRSPDPSWHSIDPRTPPPPEKLTNDHIPTTSPPRSSTPVHRSPDGKMRPDRSSHTPMRSSTPNRDRTPYQGQGLRDSLPSFHPTQSGSTISTIKSASAIAFEGILASCEPPLLHIAPLLARLGIVNEGHLRAIGRLSGETRDKEVREEALKQGVTVMEWAILLDKLQTI
ncbi:hypothetical protein D9615_006737 [Tricholomella constricta]|uniref:Uncharacterized protein n=1 Tax=Tricholomella constricta TaxID=117010 RepID=A0A8H5H6X0_9AGAR|nr:hypothetical protein D9615_006737 [Tricholomella constricta]